MASLPGGTRAPGRGSRGREQSGAGRAGAKPVPEHAFTITLDDDDDDDDDAAADLGDGAAPHSHDAAAVELSLPDNIHEEAAAHEEPLTAFGPSSSAPSWSSRCGSLMRRSALVVVALAVSAAIMFVSFVLALDENHEVVGDEDAARNETGAWPWATEQAALSFLVLGDWGRGGRSNQAEVAAQMGVWASRLDAQFVISVGDNFYENGVTSRTDPQFDSSFENVYNQPELKTLPWFLILGNHDYRGVADAQVARNGTGRWVMPSRYYSTLWEAPPGEGAMLPSSVCAAFVFIDTCPLMRTYQDGTSSDFSAPYGPQVRANLDQTDAAQQRAWLATELPALARRCPWVFAVGHHPVYSGGAHGSPPELQEQLEPLFLNHGVAAYFAGHDHDMQHLRVNNLDHWVSGAGSAIRGDTQWLEGKTEFSLERSGFLAVSLARDGSAARYAFIDLHGDVVYTVQRSAPARP